MASRRFVLPWAFGPTTTVSPDGTCRATSAWLRKSRASTHSNRTMEVRRWLRLSDGGRQADGHDQVDERLLVTPDHRWLQAIANLDPHPLPRGHGQPIREVRRIERRG